ncbi:MAG: signal peptidase I [Deltaproteobacteria bacterium]|nr:signal peptidase I [Deltaproteobacteria bacterium]
MNSEQDLEEGKSRKGTWPQALLSFAVSVVLLLTFRWVAFEPYVIPSGSMLPTLRILDFIYVNKFAYGLRLPFSSQWLWERDLPSRCDVVVFRSQTTEGQFVIKRVMGLPGEKVELLESGRIRIDDQLLPVERIGENDDSVLSRESCDAKGGERTHVMQTSRLLQDLEVDPVVYAVVVPPGQMVLFGDNRHESADSRVWGALPREQLLGQALGIWLSCEESMSGLPRVCNPATIRWSRLFQDLDQSAEGT